MSKKHHHVRVLMHRAFVVFLTVFLISDVGRVYASRNLEIIAQQGETQPDATEAEAIKLMQEGLQLQKQGSKESLLIARNKFEAALVLWEKLGDKKLQAVTLNNIGGVYDALGEKQKALQYFNQALPMSRAVGDRGGEVITLNNIAGIYEDLRDNLKALEYYNQALLLYRAVGDKQNESTVVGNLAKLERKQGNLQASLNHIKSAIAIIEDLRGTYTNQDLKTTYFATVQNYYKFYIDLLMEQHKKNPSLGYDSIALHISERSRARGLIELLAQANAKLSKNINPKFIAEEKELQLKRQAQEKILVKLINQKQPPKDTIKQTEAEIQNIIN
ncbi:MAG: tetratricopeptide repeat protein, partial [Rivularia sp. (in: cyanobacteria)]